MVKNKLFTSLSKAAISAAMLLGAAGSLGLSVGSVFAADSSGLLDNTSASSSSDSTSSSSSSSSASSADSSSASSDSSSDSSDDAADDSSTEDTDSYKPDHSYDTTSYAKPSKAKKPKTIPQTGREDNTKLAAAGAVGLAMVGATGALYAKKHKNDSVLR